MVSSICGLIWNEKTILTRLCLIFMFSFHLFETVAQEKQKGFEPIVVQRFDKELFALLSSETAERKTNLMETRPDMLDVLGKGVLNQKTYKEKNFFNRLMTYFSEPTLRSLYQDALSEYDTMDDIEKDLNAGFMKLQDLFPHMQMPTVYAHVSGLNQNVLTAEGLLSLSIDKYLGKDYKLYADFFYETQRRKMQRSYVALDYIAGWIMSEYPFAGNPKVLLDRMVYEGAVKHILSLVYPEKKENELFAYTEEELDWCESNEDLIWKYLIDQKHLFTPDEQTTAQYMLERPCQFVHPNAPSNLGSWIGLQIVKQFCERDASALSSLFQKKAQEVLMESNYKP